jgi:hypothetical protein
MGFAPAQWLDSLESVPGFYTLGVECLAIPQDIWVTLCFVVAGVSGFYRLFAECALSSNRHHSPNSSNSRRL